MIELADQLRYAIYLPAIQSNYARFATKDVSDVRPLPADLEPSDFNFLKPDGRLFHFPAALYSAGQFTRRELEQPRPCMVTTRDRQATLVIGDSGGYQVIHGNIEIKGDEDRQRIFDWLAEHTDYAMTLDVPSRAVDSPDSSYEKFEDCLDDTLENIDYFQRRYAEGKGKFLNVLQGEFEEQINEWDECITEFEFDGWAVAGAGRKNLYLVMKRLLKLIDNDKINKRLHWIHFLAVGNLETACMLTVIRENVAALLDDEGFRISMDTSGPYKIAGGYNKAYITPVIDKTGFKFRYETLDSEDACHIGSSQPFPFAEASPIGGLMTMGDLVVDRPRAGPGLDDVGIMMLINHNIYVHMKAIIDANKVFKASYRQARHNVPPRLLQARDAIGHIVRAECQFDELEKNKSLLAQI